jgi:hypothetical protein
MKGKEQKQKRKKHKNWKVVVPEFGIPFGILVSKSAPKIAWSISPTHWEPIQACTEYQMIAMTTLLRTGQMEPKVPKEDLQLTGKVIW